VNCETANLATCTVRNKMRKHFTDDTQSALVTDWFDIFPSHYTLRSFLPLFDTDIKFHISFHILKSIPCQFPLLQFCTSHVICSQARAIPLQYVRCYDHKFVIVVIDCLIITPWSTNKPDAMLLKMQLR